MQPCTNVHRHGKSRKIPVSKLMTERNETLPYWARCFEVLSTRHESIPFYQRTALNNFPVLRTVAT